MTRTASDPRAHLPLTASMFHILMALADEERHGYGMLLEIEQRTRGELRMGTGTMYSAIRRLRSKGLIQEADERPAPEQDDARRIYYRLTDLGHEVLTAEAARLDKLVAQARGKRLLPAGRGG